MIPAPAAAPAPFLPIPAVAEVLAPAPQAVPLSVQSSGSSRPPIRPNRFQEVHKGISPFLLRGSPRLTLATSTNIVYDVLDSQSPCGIGSKTPFGLDSP
ncbi:hypothetical protein AXF42_Ash009255 [Apostasia shenzhenica]|uniref:Uncharacterized protein n=1 Tax=Apostasia shenzhenica TaxID=1088818 RepID=A0A2I0B3K8_9ASPA|nr:hypothetical protein AXF42_Ash009255 [Apostasia shenzhenica]